MEVQLIRAVLGVLLACGAADSAWAEIFRCHPADGGILFQETPCPFTEPVAPEAVRPAPPRAAAMTNAPAPSARPSPGVPSAAQASVPEPPPAAPVAAIKADDAEPKPTKRKRDVLDLAARFERCRAEAPGFAEKSAAIYAAWTRRHAAVLAEYGKGLAARVRTGRRGEATPPLRLCTDDWLRSIEPLTRMPDPRFQAVRKPGSCSWTR